MNSQSQAFWTSRSFFWLGLACAAAALFWGARRVMAIQQWSVASGEVIASKLNRAKSVEGDGYTYKALITVRWKAGGQDVERVFDQWGSSTSESRYQAIVDRYKVGSLVEVRFEPSRPLSAYIEAGYTLSFFLFPLLVLVFGVAFALLGFLIGRWTKSW